MSVLPDMPLAAKVAEAKERLPLPLLMERRGLADHAKQSAFCPFHENTRTKAFSIYRDERGLWRWKCHSQCGGGDEITLLEKLDGLSNKDATRHYLAEAGLEGHSRPIQRSTRPFVASPRAASRPRDTLTIPDIAPGTADELAQLAALRKVSVAALLIATSVGLLRFATLRGHRAWIITDGERVNAQARRLDGQPWEHVGAKPWTLPGSRAAYPIGISLAEHYPNLLLVEGAPDLLAALHFMNRDGREFDCCPIAMLGASQRIPDDFLPLFAGKRIRIYPHTDTAGKEAARRWARRLCESGAGEVDGFRFDGLRRACGAPVKDLNDCTSIHPDDAAELEGLLP